MGGIAITYHGTTVSQTFLKQQVLEGCEDLLLVLCAGEKQSWFVEAGRGDPGAPLVT